MSLGLAAGRPADGTTWAIGETERVKAELGPLARLITSCSGVREDRLEQRGGRGQLGPRRVEVPRPPCGLSRSCGRVGKGDCGAEGDRHRSVMRAAKRSVEECVRAG